MISFYASYLKNKQFAASLAVGLLLLATSVVLNFYAGVYATEKASNPVTDIILDHIRVFDVDGVFIYGSIVFGAFILLLCLFRPHWAPFILKSLSLFILVRSLFIILTHIGPMPGRVYIDPSYIMSKLTFGGDLFFSGHTGMPFLMALIFWQKPLLRFIFLATSITFGAIVLMGHLHYSIDVFSAFFITYTIFHLAKKIFTNDWMFFRMNSINESSSHGRTNSGAHIAV
jgi:hypothetical protein